MDGLFFMLQLSKAAQPYQNEVGTVSCSLDLNLFSKGQWSISHILCSYRKMNTVATFTGRPFGSSRPKTVMPCHSAFPYQESTSFGRFCRFLWRECYSC